jgi:hypothetical protein
LKYAGYWMLDAGYEQAAVSIDFHLFQRNKMESPLFKGGRKESWKSFSYD